MKTENLSTLKIHHMSQAQYDREAEAGRLEPHSIYITPDEAPVFDSEPTKNSNNYITSGSVFEAVDEVRNHTHFKRFLTETDDCDQLFEDGVYVYQTATVTNGLKNAPFANAAVIEVFGADSTSTQKIQRAYRYGEPGYTAFRPLFGGKWSKWKKSPVHFQLTATKVGAIPTFMNGQTLQQLVESLDNKDPVTISVYMPSTDTVQGTIELFFVHESTCVFNTTGDINDATQYTFTCSEGMWRYTLSFSKNKILSFERIAPFDYIVQSETVTIKTTSGGNASLTNTKGDKVIVGAHAISVDGSTGYKCHIYSSPTYNGWFVHLTSISSDEAAASVDAVVTFYYINKQS